MSSLQQLVSFLKLTARFLPLARRVAARALLVGRALPETAPTGVALPTPLELLGRYRDEWGWKTAEEVQVTLADLGIGPMDLAAELEAEAAAIERVTALVHEGSGALARAVGRALADDGSLVREERRLAVFQKLAARGPAPTRPELDAARRVLCRLHATFSWRATAAALRAVAISDEERDAFIVGLARARRAPRGGAGCIRDLLPARTG
jgi:hypothetical protein